MRYIRLFEENNYNEVNHLLIALIQIYKDFQHMYRFEIYQGNFKQTNGSFALIDELSTPWSYPDSEQILGVFVRTEPVVSVKMAYGGVFRSDDEPLLQKYHKFIFNFFTKNGFKCTITSPPPKENPVFTYEISDFSLDIVAKLKEDFRRFKTEQQFDL